MHSTRRATIPIFITLLLVLTVPAVAQQNSEKESLGATVCGPEVCGPENAREDQSDGQRRAVRLGTEELLKLVKTRLPVMPPNNLHNSKLHGKVTIQVCIDPSGTVVAAEAIKGHPLAIPSAMNSINRWTFNPVLQDGKARYAVGLMTLDYDFRRPRSASR